MTLINDVYEYLCELAPLSLQMEFDNSGFQLGRGRAKISRVLLALDVTDAVADEAIRMGAKLIVSHHPLFFNGPKCISDADPGTERLLKLTEKRIAVISMHTNLDIAEGGVNDVLIRLLGAEPEPELALDRDGCGRVGMLPGPMSMAEFLPLCKRKLATNGLRYYDAGRPVQRIGVMGGSGGDCVDEAFRLGCDTYVTADIKYHEFLRAQELGINLIDGDHFCTETPVIPVLRERLAQRFPDVSFTVSKALRQTVRFL
ncbi:MAG: Nif3-like dinuclear metal center hexameric protein [Oscillospiraceae bacterium]|nr:Nif3-like dinuclear metal center hexameric protein [Oscillospiraceae bacterium]